MWSHIGLTYMLWTLQERRQERKDGECETQMCKSMLTHVQDQQVRLDELPPEFLAARNLMLECQGLAASRNGGIEVEEPPREELGLPREEPPIEAQDADGEIMEDIIEEWDMEEGIEGIALDYPDPEVANLFALETDAMGKAGEDAEADQDITGEYWTSTMDVPAQHLWMMREM